MSETKADSTQNICLIASFSALLIAGGSAAHSYNELNALKDEVKEIKKHLSGVIPFVDPSVSSKIQQIRELVEKCDARIDGALEESEKQVVYTKPIHKYLAEPPKRTYQRLTKRNESVGQLRMKPIAESNKNESDDDDIKAMMN